MGVEHRCHPPHKERPQLGGANPETFDGSHPLFDEATRRRQFSELGIKIRCSVHAEPAPGGFEVDQSVAHELGNDIPADLIVNGEAVATFDRQLAAFN